MEPQVVTARENLQAVLKSDSKALNEVVVTAMGLKRSEKALGYSATSISGDQIAQKQTTDIMSSLSGQVAGVQISSTSSDPGYTATLKGADATAQVKVTGSVDVNTPGIYTLTYTITNEDGFSTTDTRNVLVADPTDSPITSGFWSSTADSYRVSSTARTPLRWRKAPSQGGETGWWPCTMGNTTLPPAASRGMPNMSAACTFILH